MLSLSKSCDEPPIQIGKVVDAQKLDDRVQVTLNDGKQFVSCKRLLAVSMGQNVWYSALKRIASILPERFEKSE